MNPLTSGDFASASDPLALFEAWLGEASKSEPSDPTAMALATADKDGMPNVRMVLLKGCDERGFVFYTNTESAKGRELEAAAKAAIVFHWKTLTRQVRARGPMERVSDEEADIYYASRPYGSRIGAWASAQSRALDKRETLEALVKSFEAKHPEDSPVPRPPHWHGYRLVPREIEFWHDRPFRLHDRIVFRRDRVGGAWQKERLYP